MKRKTLLKILAALMALMLLGGCAQPAAPGNAPENPSDAAPPSDASGNAQAEKVKITMYTEWVGTHPFTGYFNSRLDAFKTAHPEVEVEVDELAGNTTATMDGKLKIAISAGELPDVFTTADASIMNLAKESNLLYELTDLINGDEAFKSHLDMNDLATWNGGTDHIYAVNGYKEVFGFFYNKQLLEKAGYSSFPTTWEDFWKLCDALKAQGVAPMSLCTTTAWLSSTTFFSLLSEAGETGKALAHTTDVTDYTGPEYVHAAAQLQKCFQEYTTPDAPGSDLTVAINNFLTGQTAMIVDGAWRIEEFTSPETSQIGDYVGVARLPGNGAVSYPGTGFFCGSKDEAKAKAAYELIKSFIGADGQAEALSMIGAIPTSTSLDVSNLGLHPLMTDILDLRDNLDYYVTSCWRVYSAATRAIVSQEQAALGMGQITPEEYCKNLTNANA